MTNSEFHGLTTFKTHSLDLLLRLSGQEGRIKQAHFADWNVVVNWDPESRYNVVGTAQANSTSTMIQSTESLLAVL